MSFLLTNFWNRLKKIRIFVRYKAFCINNLHNVNCIRRLGVILASCCFVTIKVLLRFSGNIVQITENTFAKSITISCICKNSQSFAIVFEKFRIFATIFGNNSSA